MAIVINGTTGIDMGGNPVSNVSISGNSDVVDKHYVDGKTSTDVYQGSYGLEWNETFDSYRRVGASGYTAIQSLMRRCVLNADGSVNYYLDQYDSNLKEDGTLADLTGASTVSIY